MASPVAKHGNRAVSSRTGSADVLEALGVDTSLNAEQASAIFRQNGFAFLMAPSHHPAMRHGASARRELGVRTIFNCLGPLANPAGASHQLLGAYDDALRPILARTLLALGCVRAWVVRGVDGMDEMSPYGNTRVTQLDGGSLSERVVKPADFGLQPSPPGACQGGNADENAEAIRQILSAKPHPARNAVILNAAAALVVARNLDEKAAATRARKLIDTGSALQKLHELKAATQAATS